jgi:hypothetical protein
MLIPRNRSTALVLVLFVMLAAAWLLSGCGGSSATNFPAAHEVQVDPQVTALMQAWAEAQRTGDEDALEALYMPDYAYNGQTAHDMGEELLLPETPDTRVTSLQWRMVAPPHHDHAGHAHVHSAQHDHEHEHEALVMARITLRGVVSASFIADLATGLEDDHDHEGHTHTHSVKTAAGVGTASLTGTVPVTAQYDVVFLVVWGDHEPAQIAEQRLELGALQFGGGMAATVLRDIHIHPDEAHPGETLDVHGQYALLPPGGVIQARVADHEAHEAHFERGRFEVHLTAPLHEGEFLVSVEAFAGNVESRTASLTIAQREVHVDDHIH